MQRARAVELVILDEKRKLHVRYASSCTGKGKFGKAILKTGSSIRPMAHSKQQRCLRCPDMSCCVALLRRLCQGVIATCDWYTIFVLRAAFQNPISPQALSDAPQSLQRPRNRVLVSVLRLDCWHEPRFERGERLEYYRRRQRNYAESENVRSGQPLPSRDRQRGLSFMYPS